MYFCAFNLRTMSFDDLREQYPVFTFDHYQYELAGNELHIQFHFLIGDSIAFRPRMVLRPGRHAQWPADLNTLDGIVFHIGMIELISYWKCTCSPTILIKPYHLSEEQQLFWRKLYWHGLGELLISSPLWPPMPPHSPILARRRATASSCPSAGARIPW